MPQWVRHTVQTVTNKGFWVNETTPVIDDNCSKAEQTALQAQFDLLRMNPSLDLFPALKAGMLSMWGGMRIDCCFDATRPPRGDTPDGRIFICNMTPLQQQQAICRGLVDEFMSQPPNPGPQLLEALAVLFALYNPVGTPTAAEKASMLALPVFGGNPAEREGQFLIWNRTTGSVFNKTTTTTGGFWTSSTTTAKGALGFTNPAWIG